MKKYLLTLVTTGFVSLQASAGSFISETPKTTTGGMDPSGYAKLQKKTQMALNPYLKSTGGHTFFIEAGYAGGIIAPQNRTFAVSGINFDHLVDKRTSNTLIQFPQNWSNGFAATLGYARAQNTNFGLIADLLFFTNSNASHEVTLDINSLKMGPTFPNDPLTGNTNLVFRAKGQYELPAYLAYKFCYLGSFFEVAKLSLFIETGFAGSYTNHSLNTSYSIKTDPPVSDDENLEQIVKQCADETICSFGPWFGIQVRKSLRHGVYLKATFGATGQLTYRDLHSSDLRDTNPQGKNGTYDILSRNLFSLTQATEASLGLGSAFEYDALDLDWAFSWVTTSRPDYTMLVAPAYGIGAGTLSSFNASFMKTVLAIKF